MDYRKELKKQLGLIPDAVKHGSVQTVVRWKERARLATMVLKNSKSTDTQLKQAIADLMRI